MGQPSNFPTWRDDARGMGAGWRSADAYAHAAGLSAGGADRQGRADVLLAAAARIHGQVPWLRHRPAHFAARHIALHASIELNRPPDRLLTNNCRSDRMESDKWH